MPYDDPELRQWLQESEDWLESLPPKENPTEAFTASTSPDKMQIGGDHYLNQAIQPWTAMESWLTPEQFSGFLRGNVIKYIARCDAKDGIQDLKKAQHYLTKLIEFETTIKA